jgi:hypothetical protein
MAVVLLTTGAMASATQMWMSEADIRAALIGREMDGVYASGLTFSESYTTDGRLDYLEGSRPQGRRMTGHWSIADRAFCTFYDAGALGGCFRVRQIGQNCYEFHFLAGSEADAAKAVEPIGYTARGWRRGEPTACSGVPTV